MKCLFLDRDGVINKDYGHVGTLDRFEYTSHFLENCNSAIGNSVPIVIVTNQAGLSKGYYSFTDHALIENKIRKDFRLNDLFLLDYFFCPHHPKGVIMNLRAECDCRKPKPGLFIKAAEMYNIDLSSSVIIGDKNSDIVAATKSGVQGKFLVKKDDSKSIQNALCFAAQYLKK